MNHQARIQGHKNIIIQGVTDSTITLSAFGETKEIQNELSILRETLQQLQAQSMTRG